MEEKYDLLLNYFYFDISKIKEAQIHRVKNIIVGSRIGENILFNSYGKAYFDSEDHKHTHMYVEPIKEYDKSKVNCLIYDVKTNCQNEGYFDKLFIYLNQIKEQYFGYVFYNSETNHSCQKILIDPQEDYLVTNLVKDFLTMFKIDVFKHFSEKYDAIKKYKHDNPCKIPGIEDYENMMARHKEKQKIGYY